MAPFSRNFRFQKPSRSAGAVLAIVLVVLVVMMLGGVALLRSVDTSALLSGNLAFKRDTVNRSTIGLNEAFKVMKSLNFATYAESNAGCAAGACTDAAKWLAMNYSPRLLETDANGIPVVMADATAFDAKFSTIKPIDTLPGKKEKDGSLIRFLIERMCTDFGPSNENVCAVSDRVQVGGDTRNSPIGAVSLPLYRITVRSDGPRNTQTYAQAIVTTRVK
ncbi:MAG: hypothetical protein JSR69_18870 [Proteobacteria bacterium]|nr:hypothetical protein [Pseudomonadota bacterium]